MSAPQRERAEISRQASRAFNHAAAQHIVSHDLLLERERLLANDVRAKYERLKRVEDLLKDIVDDVGPIIDEELGIRVSYDHSGTKVWDLVALSKIMRPDDFADVIETVLVASKLKEKIDAGKVTDRELRGAYVLKPRRGPLALKPLPRSAR